MSEYRLMQEIIDRSFAKAWPEAKLEWELVEVYEAHDREPCLCGHFPISTTGRTGGMRKAP